jgi:hypothetical protein
MTMFYPLEHLYWLLPRYPLQRKIDGKVKSPNCKAKCSSRELILKTGTLRE